MRKIKTLLTIIPLMGLLIGNTFAQGKITLVTEIPVGQVISLSITTVQGVPPTITGATGTFINEQFSNFTVQDPTITIEGELVRLGCGGNKITSITLEGTDKLVLLGCNKNQIKTLDISEAPKLEQISCSSNMIEKLDFSTAPNIYRIYCYSNKIKGENMTNLVNSLPVNTTPLEYELFIVDKSNPAEENVATIADVNIAKAKNWVVYNYNGGYYTGYTGEESSSIESVEGAKMKLYPSVASDKVTLEVPNSMLPSKVTIVSMEGRDVYSAKITSEQTVIPLSNLAEGTYLVKVGTSVRKLIKKGI